MAVVVLGRCGVGLHGRDARAAPSVGCLVGRGALLDRDIDKREGFTDASDLRE